MSLRDDMIADGVIVPRGARRPARVVAVDQDYAGRSEAARVIAHNLREGWLGEMSPDADPLVVELVKRELRKVPRRLAS